MDAIQAKTGIKPIYELAPERESDHLWWISDMSKFKRDYLSFNRGVLSLTVSHRLNRLM